MSRILETTNHRIHLRPIEPFEHFGLRDRLRPIDHKLFCEHSIMSLLEQKGISHAKLYITLKSLYGETYDAYDDFKCSYLYCFLLECDSEKNWMYVMDFCDFRSTIDFRFSKVMEPNNTTLDIGRFHKPLPEFTVDEIDDVKRGFINRLIAYFESHACRIDEPDFIRSNDSTLTIYGKIKGQFIERRYRDQEEYLATLDELGQIDGLRINKSVARW